MKFRFSIRDLFWQTLVVAVGLGWLVREWQQRATEKAWRGRTRALEYALEQDGWEVRWDFEKSLVTVLKRSGVGYRAFPIYTDYFDPIAQDD